MKRCLYPFLFVNFLLCLVTVLHAQPVGYHFVREIVIHESEIPDGASLSNFPFLVKITHPDLRSVANGGHVASNNGHDVLFYLNTCSILLDHQVDYYDPVTGELAVWVRIPSLSTTADTRVYMYYGNNSVSSSTSVAGIWETSYSGIWHLGNDPTAAAPQMADATANGHNGTTHGSMTAASLVNGKIGKALSFDEVNDYVRIPDFLYGQELTVSFWFNATEVNGNSYQYLFSHGVWGAPNSLNIYAGEDNITIPAEVKNRRMLKTVFRDNNDANNFDTLDAGNTFINGNWHYYTMRIQDWGGATIYIDGVQVAVYSVWGANTFNPATDIFLAGREDLNAGRFFGGLLDEVRISSVWRSSNWILTEYNNQNNPAAFSTVGIEGPSLNFCSLLAFNRIELTAARSGSAVKLQWTGRPTDTAQFSIERSGDGNAWQFIGSAYNKYTFTDAVAPGSALFYRVTRYRGSTVLTSSVIKVEAICCEPAIRIYPNPSPGGRLFAGFPGTEAPEQFALLDLSGILIQPVTAEKTHGNTYMLTLSRDVKQGVYLLRFRYKGGVQTKVVVIGSNQ